MAESKVAESKMVDEIIIDATDAVIGRISTFAAKQSLLGKKVVILNCEKAIRTGDRKMLMAKFEEKRARGGMAQKGPYHHKNPERIVKRAIRGMLPYKHERGASAFDRIRCYNFVPEEYASAKTISLKRPIHSKFIYLSELRI